MKEKGEMKRAIGVKEQEGRKVQQSSLRHRGTGEQGKGGGGVIFRLECVTRSAAACVALLNADRGGVSVKGVRSEGAKCAVLISQCDSPAVAPPDNASVTLWGM